MSSIPKATEGGTEKIPSSTLPPGEADNAKPWRDDAAWPSKPAPLPEPVDFSILLPKEEREAKDAHSRQIIADIARQDEAKARQEEAKTERAKINSGSSLLPTQTDQAAIVLEWAMSKNLAALKLEYLVDPFLPAKCVVGFFGRGSTAKSSFVATMAASISDDCSTLWVSVEELKDWIAQRHVRSGGAEGTLAVFSHNAVKHDAQGRVTGSTFDIYRDLNGAILAAAEGARSHYNPARLLRFVVLDTAVGLTTWGKGDGPNDDAAVKRLLGYLQSLAEQHNVCIAIIGHSNKGKHDYFADTVAGSSAWTNSPRLSFVHATDRREEYAYVMRVAKTNLSSFFAVAYRTEPVLTLHHHEDGHASVLCRVETDSVIWGGDASMELFDDATRKPESDDSTAGSKRQGLITSAIQTLVEAVMSTQPEQHISRADVEGLLGRKVGRREWVKVDSHLNLHPTVVIERGEQNRLFYKRRA